MAITPRPISLASTVSGNAPRIARIGENASETFKIGTPVQLGADGYVTDWDGTDVSDAIAGISTEPGSNLTTDATAQTVTFGSVPFQSSAKNIPRGAPYNDGKCGFYTANEDNVFSATFGNNGNEATPAAADVGVSYGLTKDATSGFWYVDKNKTGASAVLKISALDPRDPASTSAGRVLFTFLPAAAQAIA